MNWQQIGDFYTPKHICNCRLRLWQRLFAAYFSTTALGKHAFFIQVCVAIVIVLDFFFNFSVFNLMFFKSSLLQPTTQ